MERATPQSKHVAFGMPTVWSCMKILPVPGDFGAVVGIAASFRRGTRPPTHRDHRPGLGVHSSGELVCRLDEAHYEHGFDVVVLQRWMNQDAPEIIRRARSLGQVVVNDVDDWFFGLPTSNDAFNITHPRNNARENVNHYRKVLAASTAHRFHALPRGTPAKPRTSGVRPAEHDRPATLEGARGIGLHETRRSAGWAPYLPFSRRSSPAQRQHRPVPEPQPVHPLRPRRP